MLSKTKAVKLIEEYYKHLDTCEEDCSFNTPHTLILGEDRYLVDTCVLLEKIFTDLDTKK